MFSVKIVREETDKPFLLKNEGEHTVFLVSDSEQDWRRGPPLEAGARMVFNQGEVKIVNPFWIVSPYEEPRVLYWRLDTP